MDAWERRRPACRFVNYLISPQASRLRSQAIIEKEN